MKDYNKAIISTPTVLVEFFASWCPHCQRMMPVVEEVKNEVEGSVNVFQYDIDKNSALADKLNIESVPTFIIYNNGKEVKRVTGEMTADALLKQIGVEQPA